MLIESLFIILKLYFNFLFFIELFFFDFLEILKQSEKNLIKRDDEETEYNEL